MYACVADVRQSSSLTYLNFSTLIYYGFRVDTMHHDSGIHMLSQAPGFCNSLLSVYFSLLCTVTTSRLLSDDASFVWHYLSILISDKRPQLVKWASWPPTTVKSLID